MKLKKATCQYEDNFIQGYQKYSKGNLTFWPHMSLYPPELFPYPATGDILTSPLS